MPKDKDKRSRGFAFITYKHAVSVPYTLALLNGITLYGKPLHLDPREGAESERNQFVDQLMHFRSSSPFQSSPQHRYYTPSHDDQSSRSPNYETRREPQQGEPNQWNAYPTQSSPYNAGLEYPPLPSRLPHIYPSPVSNQERFIQNSPHSGYSYGSRGNWSRNHH